MIMENGKIGVFGGTFNPVHRGHELTAVRFYEKFGLERLIIMPANVPPHKQVDAGITAVQRLEMCRICFKKYQGAYNICVSDFEIKKDGLSYTFDTVAELAKIYKGGKLYFLVGSDMFLYLEKWYKYRELLELCAFVVAFRNTDGDSDSDEARQVLEMRGKFTGMGAEIYALENEPFEVSSTELRDKLRGRIKNGVDLEEYICGEVLQYIKEREIYV